MSVVFPKTRLKISLFLVFLSFVFALFSWQYFFQEKLTVTYVIDGDTIKLDDGRTVRYIGVDSPEEDECFSWQAKKVNSEAVLDKKVRLEMDKNEMDRFGRYLAYVFIKNKAGDEVFVNEYLLREGAAEFFLDTVNLRYQALLVQAADQAHQDKKGLWQACAPDPKVSCQIKGNLDRLDKRWYHLPTFRHYDQVVINLDHGDRWFCTEEQAQEAGFERARE